jgi:hypothetical protein
LGRFTQSLEEGLYHVGTSGQVVRQQAYSSDLACLLRLGGERRGEERGSTSKEGPAVHHSIT